MARDVLTPKEAAAFLRCSLTAVYAMLHDGTLQHYKVGRSQFRIPVEVLEKHTGRKYVAPDSQPEPPAG